MLARTQELTLDEVRTFWRMLCRPVGAVVVVDPGQGQTEAIFGATTAALGPWTAALGGAEPAARQAPLQALRGLVWAERAGLPRAGVLFARSEPGAEHALEVLVLQACLTQGGIGGRLARELERTSGTAPILVEETVRDGAQRYAFLSTTATVEQSVLLANALARAVDSLTQRPPEEDELRIALARARLQVMEDESDRRAWLSTAVTLGRLHAAKPFDLGEEMKRLVDPKLLDLRAAAAAFRASVVATVVLGGALPADADARKLVDPIPPERIAETLSPDDTGREQAAKPYLDAALRALGGRENLTGVRGFAASAIVKGDNGAAFEESVFWREDGRLRRVRRVLGTKIEAVIAGTQGSEVSGEQTLELGSDEVRSLLQRAERHPVALISGWVYGRFRFKLVSLRSVDDREMAILELIDPSRERMRVQIDTGSGLVRQVETREHWPSVGKVQIVETYTDYRTQKGVRSPFHVVTNVDSGGMTVVTDYGTFVPRTPPDQDLVRGGPERPEAIDEEQDSSLVSPRRLHRSLVPGGATLLGAGRRRRVPGARGRSTGALDRGARRQCGRARGPRRDARRELQVRPPRGGVREARRRVRGGPWRWLVLTDHRPETADAISAIPKDVKVLAHHRTDERLRAAGKRGADLTFDSTVNLRVGGKMVTIQHKGAAQTDGVIYAHFHESQVLALGDLVSNQAHPSLWPDEGGSIRAALRVLKDLRKDYKSSTALRIVPGLGEPGPHALFDETIGYWTALLDLGIEAHRHGLTVSEAQASAETLRLKYAAWRGDRFTKNVAIAYAETNQ